MAKDIKDCSINELILQLATQQVIAKEGDIDLSNQAVMLEIFTKATELVQQGLDKDALIQQINETRMACIANGCGKTSEAAMSGAGITPPPAQEPAQPKTEASAETAAQAPAPTASAHDYSIAESRGNVNVAKVQTILNDCGYDISYYSSRRKATIEGEAAIDGDLGRSTRGSATKMLETALTLDSISDEQKAAIEAALKDVKDGNKNLDDTTVATFENAAVICEQIKAQAAIDEQAAAEKAAEDAALLAQCAAITEEKITWGCGEGNSRDDVRPHQKTLKELGYPVGPVDGIFGPKTARATAELEAAMRANSIEATIDGKFTSEERDALTAALRNEVDLKRESNLEAIKDAETDINLAKAKAEACGGKPVRKTTPDTPTTPSQPTTPENPEVCKDGVASGSEEQSAARRLMTVARSYGIENPGIHRVNMGTSNPGDDRLSVHDKDRGNARNLCESTNGKVQDLRLNIDGVDCEPNLEIVPCQTPDGDGTSPRGGRGHGTGGTHGT